MDVNRTFFSPSRPPLLSPRRCRAGSAFVSRQVKYQRSYFQGQLNEWWSWPPLRDNMAADFLPNDRFLSLLQERQRQRAEILSSVLHRPESHADQSHLLRPANPLRKSTLKSQILDESTTNLSTHYLFSLSRPQNEIQNPYPNCFEGYPKLQRHIGDSKPVVTVDWRTWNVLLSIIEHILLSLSKSTGDTRISYPVSLLVYHRLFNPQPRVCASTSSSSPSKEGVITLPKLLSWPLSQSNRWLRPRAFYSYGFLVATCWR